MASTPRVPEDVKDDDPRPPPGRFDEELGVWVPHAFCWPPSTRALEKLFADVDTAIDIHWRAFAVWWFLFLLDRKAAGQYFRERAEQGARSTCHDGERRKSYTRVVGDRSHRSLSRELRRLLSRRSLPGYETTVSDIRGGTPATRRRWAVAREAQAAQRDIDRAVERLERVEAAMRDDLASRRQPWEELRLTRLAEGFELCARLRVTHSEIVCLVLRHEHDWLFRPCADWIDGFASLSPGKRVQRVKDWEREAKDFAKVNGD